MSLHFQEGGTGVTNFSISKKEIYEQAIKEYGDNSLFISDDIMVPERREPGTGMCLHHTQRGDLSAFWRIFDRIEREKEGE